MGLKLQVAGLIPSTADQGTSKALKRAKAGSLLRKQFSSLELRLKLLEMKALIAQGKNDLEIQATLEVKSRVYNEMRRELYRQETATLYSKSVEDVYLEYKWAQDQCIDDLNKLIDRTKETKQDNAMMGAIRAKSDIIDKIIKMGQDMGIINKQPEKKLVIHGHTVAQLSTPELRRMIAGEMEGLAAMVNKYGVESMDGTPMEPPLASAELPAGPQFSADERPGFAQSGPDKSMAARKSRMDVKRVKVIDVPATER